MNELEKPKHLLFCDNPMCFATHIAKKHFSHQTKPAKECGKTTSRLTTADQDKTGDALRGSQKNGGKNK